MILLVDNYDSFTWNLWQLMAGLGANVEVQRNDMVTVEDVVSGGYQAIVLGPGPGRPAGAGICPELLKQLPDQVPLLGICLGFQALVEHYGGRVERDPVPVHGRASAVHHSGQGMFQGVPSPLFAGRYHSLRAERTSLGATLMLDAWTTDGVPMAVRHLTAARSGVQFHPESILTPCGAALMKNFLSTLPSRS